MELYIFQLLYLAKGAHGVNLEIWFNVEGYSINSLEKNFRFPKTPDLRTLTHKFAEPPNIGESFGSRLYAWFSPPKTGYYVFYICEYEWMARFCNKLFW